MSDNIHVAVRVRPLIPREIKDDAQIHWKVENGSFIYQVSSPSTAFCFDRVFDARETNDIIYRELCYPIVESVMQGINGTIFAYGQTSSGKTFTMMGDSESSGIISSTIEDIFNAIENMPNREFLLRVSYMEIYNEMVVDLFSTEEKKNLKVQENTEGYTSICGLEEIVIRSTQDVLNWMKKGERKRHIGETNMNERSSRSHTIFRMIIESRRRDTDEDSAVIVSQFNLVDLAGSERAAETVTTDRFKESVSINKSLFTLSQVISQLSENDGQHITYRASKLTRILKNSLGGNARTVIICTVTPASLDQTLSTLKFASRAKCIKNKPQVNEILTDEALLKRYARKIKELSKQLEEQQQGGNVKAMQLELEEKDRKIENLRQSLREIKEKLIVSNNAPEKFSAIPRNPRRETWGGLIMKQNFRPPQLGNIKPFCHLPLLPTLIEESFSTVADLSSEFLPEFREELLSGGSKLSSSPHTLSPLRFSFPKSTVHVEVQTETSFGNATNSEVKTDFGTAAYTAIEEETVKLKSDLESMQKKYDELREFTCLEKEVCGTDNGLTNEIKALKEKIKFLQEENTDLFAKLKSASDKIILKEQAAENREIELLKQLSEKEKSVSSLNEKLTSVQMEIESLNSQVKQMGKAEETVESLRTQFNEMHESNSVYQSLVKDLEAQVNNLQESNSDMTKKMLKIESSYSDAQNEVSRLINELNEKDAIIANIDNQLRASEKLSDDRAIEIKKLNDRVSELSDMIRNFSSQSESNHNIDVTSQNITVDDLQISESIGNESVIYGSYNKSDGDRYGAFVQETEDKEMKIMQLSGQLEEYEEQIQALSSKIETLNSNRIDSSHLVEDLQAHIKTEKENSLQYLSTIETLKNHISELQGVNNSKEKLPTETDQLLVEERKVAKDRNELLVKYNSLLEEKDEIIKMMVDEIYNKAVCGDFKKALEEFVLQEHKFLKESVDKVMSSYSEISAAISEICQHFIDAPKETELFKDLIYAQEQEISLFADKLRKSEGLLSEKESLLNLLVAELAGMEDIVQDMKNQLEISKDCLKIPHSGSCTKCVELKIEMKSITDKLCEKESEFLSLKNQLLETQSVLNGKVSLSDGLLEQLNQAKEDISEYRKDIEEKEKAILDYKNRTNDLEGKITELLKKDSEISLLHNQIMDLQSIVNVKESMIEDLHKQLEQSRVTILELEHEVASKRSTLLNHENLIDDLKMNISTLKEEYSYNNQKLTTAEETIAEYEKELEQKKNIISNYESHLSNLKDDFEGVISEMRTSHESEIQKINDIHAKEMSDLHEDLKNQHREEKEKLASQFADDLEIKLAELDKKHCENSIKEKCEIDERLKMELSTDYEKRLNFLKKELQEKESIIANKSEKLEKAENELAVLRGKNQKKNELLSVVNERHETAISAAVAGKEAEIQDLKHNLEDKISECDALKREVDVLKRENKTSTEESLSALKASHANEILQMSDRHEKEKQSLFESLMAEFDAEKKKLSEELTSKLKASHENEIRQVNDLHERVKQSLMDSLMVEFNMEREKLADKFNKDLAFKLSELEKKYLDQSFRQKNEMEGRLISELSSKYENQLVALKHEFAEKDAILRSKLVMLEKVEGEMTALKMKEKKTDELLKKVNENQQIAVATVAAEKDNVIQGLKHNLQDTLNECDALKRELNALLSRKDDLSSEHYKNELSKSMNKCEELNSEISKMKNVLLQLKTDYEEEVKKTGEVSQKVIEQNKLIQSLQSSFDQKSMECDSLKQQLEEMFNKTNPEGRSETLENYKYRVMKEINAYKMKKDKERELLKSSYEKDISEKTKIHDQIALEMKERNEKLTHDFNSLVHERDALKATCKDLEAQNQQLVGVLKGETKWLEKQNFDVKAHKEELAQKNNMLVQLKSEISKQRTELVSLRNERQMLVGEIDKLKNEIVARNDVCIELQKKIELIQNSQSISLSNKDEKITSAEDTIEQLRQELVDEKQKNEKILEGLKHWAQKAENYKQQVKHLKEANECTTSLDKLPNAVAAADEDGSDKPLDATDYCFQSGAIAKYKLYMMDSELYQKNKEIDRLKKEINKLKTVIASKRATKSSTKLGQNAAGVSTDQQPAETQSENTVFVKPRTRKRSENDVSSIAKKLSGAQNQSIPVAAPVKPKSVALSKSTLSGESDIQGGIRKHKTVKFVSSETENTLSAFKSNPREQGEHVVPVEKKLSEARDENTAPAFYPSSRVQNSENSVCSAVKMPAELQNKDTLPTFVKPASKTSGEVTVQSENGGPSTVKNAPEAQNGNIPPAFVKPWSRTHNKITVQIESDTPAAVKTMVQNTTSLFAKPRPTSQSEIDAFDKAQNGGALLSSAQHRPRAPSEIKVQGEETSTAELSNVEDENVQSTFIKRRTTTQSAHSGIEAFRENIPPALVGGRSRVRSENDTPLGTKLLSQQQRDGITVKPRSEEQCGNPSSGSAKPLPRTGTTVASENIHPEGGSARTVSASVKLFSIAENADSVPTTKPLAELQTARSYGKHTSFADKAGSNATRTVYDGISTEMKSTVPTDRLPQRGKRKFIDSNECKQQ